MIHGPPGSLPSTGQLAALAVLMEITAAKPGNVHRGADFEDVSFFEFAAAAQAIVPAVEQVAVGGRVGSGILQGVQATRSWVGTNTNLGTLLLLMPLAAVPPETPLEAGVQRVLANLNSEDAASIYEAIRYAAAGGLGEAPEADISGPAPADIIAAMRLAEDHDLVARQYSRGYQELFAHVVPAIEQGLQRGWSLSTTIIHAQIQLMARFPDSLIGRKCGTGTAQQSAAYAQRVLDAGSPGDEDYHRALGDLDFWLRSDYHRRNPGTTADLLAAGLFAALRMKIISPPFRFYQPA